MQSRIWIFAHRLALNCCSSSSSPEGILVLAMSVVWTAVSLLDVFWILCLMGSSFWYIFSGSIPVACLVFFCLMVSWHTAFPCSCAHLLIVTLSHSHIVLAGSWVISGLCCYEEQDNIRLRMHKNSELHTDMCASVSRESYYLNQLRILKQCK